MVDGPRLRAIRNHLPIVPLVPGRVWDVLQIANHYDIWIVSTTPNPDWKIGIALIDLNASTPYCSPRIYVMPFAIWFRFRAGQGELKYGASRLIRVCPQPAPMGIDDGPADRQPHPHSAGLRGVESLENALEMFRINARPGIAHCHENAISSGFARC